MLLTWSYKMDAAIYSCQSPSNKILRLALLRRQNLRFGWFTFAKGIHNSLEISQVIQQPIKICWSKYSVFYQLFLAHPKVWKSFSTEVKWCYSGAKSKAVSSIFFTSYKQNNKGIGKKSSHCIWIVAMYLHFILVGSIVAQKKRSVYISI